MEEKSSNEKGILWSARYWSRSFKKNVEKIILTTKNEIRRLLAESTTFVFETPDARIIYKNLKIEIASA